MLFLEWDLLHGHVFRFSVDEDAAAFFFVSNLAVIFLFYPIGKLTANHFRHDALSMGFREQGTESAHFLWWISLKLPLIFAFLKFHA